MGLGIERATQEWGWEVDDEAQRLIERGTPPWTAAEQAVANVSRRRRERANERDIERSRLGMSAGCGDCDPLP